MADKLAPIDESVKVPRGVLASSARAEEIHKAAYTPPDGATAAPPEPTPTNPTPTPQAAPTPTPEPPKLAPVAAPPQVAPPTDDDWKQKYFSLKGRYDAEVPNMRTRITNLEQLLSSDNRPPPRPAAAATPPQVAKRITEADVKEYSPELIDMVQRAALDAVSPVIDGAVKKVKSDLKTDIGKVDEKAQTAAAETAKSARGRLLAYMAQQLPNWEVINRHPKFHNWLDLTDPLSGAIRKRLLNDALNRNDAVRVFSFFRAFLAEEGQPAPTREQPNPTPPANGAGDGKVPLASLAAPGKPAASGAPPTVTPQSEKPTYTRAQISAFYRDKHKAYRGREKEADAIEADIFAAGREGRVIG